MCGLPTSRGASRVYFNSHKIPVLGFIGYSGSGKTTLMEQVVLLLHGRGMRVGALKHDAHRFEVDKPGKDSWRFREAGAQTTVISSAELIVLQRRTAEETPLADLLDLFVDEDIILVEGHKAGPHPKIEVHRPELGHPFLWPVFEHVLALATPKGLIPESSHELSLPVLDLDNAPAIAECILTSLQR